jgi:transglutaminase-like putative cysteine protease
MLAAPARTWAEPPAGTALPQRPFHLESRPALHWEVTFTHRHAPFHGVVYYAVPPDDPCQTIHSVGLYAETRKGRIEAVRVTDAGPFKKPLLKLDLNALAPFTVTAQVDVQLHLTKLGPGPVPGRGGPLGPVQRREFLDDGWPNAKARAWFTGWMKGHKLIRGGEEPDAFAFRVLQFMQAHFRYVIPDNLPEFKAMVARDPVMGDWHYTIETFSGECWRLSDTYCRVMRMNGIPARLVSGNYFGPDNGHHLRSLVYLPEVGWVPVEVTTAVSARPKPALDFFGTWGGNMLIGNQNIDFELEGPKGKWNIGTLDGLAFGGANGKWEFPNVQIKARPLPPAKPRANAK